MITRSELRSIPELHKQIEREKEQLEYLEEKATALPPVMSEHERVQSSPSNNAGKYVDAATDLRKEIEAQQKKLKALKAEAKVFIDTIPPGLTKKILQNRYLKCYNWYEIADLLGYQMRYLQQLERDATYRLTL